MFGGLTLAAPPSTNNSLLTTAAGVRTASRCGVLRLGPGFVDVRKVECRRLLQVVPRCIYNQTCRSIGLFRDHDRRGVDSDIAFSHTKEAADTDHNSLN